VSLIPPNGFARFFAPDARRKNREYPSIFKQGLIDPAEILAGARLYASAAENGVPKAFWCGIMVDGD
jgi:hypothetical protein